MTETIKNAVGGVDVAVIVQALITLILTIAVVVTVALERTPNEMIVSAWLISLGLWMPMPNNEK